MTDFKNLKLPKRTHDLLVSRANALGMKVYSLADALILSGLKMDATAVATAVAEAQQEATPPGAGTTPAERPEQS